MRRSRIKLVPFAAGLLVGLIATIWYVTAPAQLATVSNAPACNLGLESPHAPLLATPEPAPLPLPATGTSPPVWINSVVETPGFPDDRVRLARVADIPPDELYTKNRVIFRQVRIDANLQGMQISGQVLTDFVCDRGPRSLPVGPLLGMKLFVELYHYDAVVERSPEPRRPRIDPRRVGAVVEGQSVVVSTHELRGEFGVAHFALPRLAKPLPPGLYRLVAALHFVAQDHKLVGAMKWCSSLYGMRTYVNSVTLEAESRSVFEDPSLHQEIYRFLIEDIGTLKDEAVIEVGRLLNTGEIELVGPRQAADGRAPNIRILTLHHMVAEQVQAWAHHLDNVDEVIDSEVAARERALRQKRQLLKEDHERIANWKAEAAEDKQRIIRDNAAQISRHGGRVSAAEQEMLAVAEGAAPSILGQIAGFQDELALQLWILADGVCQYAGWHSMNHPAYEVYTSIERGSLPAEVFRPRADWEQRTETWRFVPVEMRDVAFAYLRRKGETYDWRPGYFIVQNEKKLRLDVPAWTKLRAQWLDDFQAACEPCLARIDTTRVYALQVWPKAVKHVSAMIEDATLMPWAWEFWIHTELQGEHADAVKASWVEVPKRIQHRFPQDAATSPGKVKSRFDTGRNALASAIGLQDFMSRYAKAVQAGTLPPGRG